MEDKSKKEEIDVFKTSDKQTNQDFSINVVGVIDNPKEANKEINTTKKMTAKQRYWEKVNISFFLII